MLEFFMFGVAFLVFLFSLWLGGCFMDFWNSMGFTGDFIPGFVLILIFGVVNVGFWFTVCWVLYKAECRKKEETRKRYKFSNANKCPNCNWEFGTEKYRPEMPKEINIVKICKRCGFEY